MIFKIIVQTIIIKSQAIKMKSNLGQQQKKGQRPSVSASYLSSSSYSEKYRKKAAKPSYEIDRVMNFSKATNVVSQFEIETDGLSRSLEKENGVRYKQTRKVQQSRRTQQPSKVQHDQWIGNIPQSFPQKDSQQQQSPGMLTSVVKKPSNILIQQQMLQSLDTYQQYRSLEQQYLNELQQIKQQTDKIQYQCNLQRKRIAESQQNLLVKRKKLKELEENFLKVVEKNEREKSQESQMIAKYEKVLGEMRTEYEAKRKGYGEEEENLRKQMERAIAEHQSLTNQLANLQRQLTALTHQSQHQSTLTQLQSQHSSLLQQLQVLQQQQLTLEQQLSQLSTFQHSTTIPSQHKKYLQIYQKTFITAQLHKAQQILKMKDQQKHQLQELQRRKAMIKDKKIQLAQKQKRINQKNKLIDKLTQDIREKSTTLLNLYQQQHQ